MFWKEKMGPFGRDARLATAEGPSGLKCGCSSPYLCVVPGFGGRHGEENEGRSHQQEGSIRRWQSASKSEVEQGCENSRRVSFDATTQQKEVDAKLGRGLTRPMHTPTTTSVTGQRSPTPFRSGAQRQLRRLLACRGRTVMQRDRDARRPVRVRRGPPRGDWWPYHPGQHGDRVRPGSDRVPGHACSRAHTRASM